MIATPIIERLESWSRDFLARIADTISAVTPVGWAFVVIAALALIWLVSANRAQTRLGPIEVTALVHDQADDREAPALQALTADFRERLWRLGLTPPSVVPRGSPQANLIKAVEASGPQGKIIAPLLEALPTPPSPPAFKVASTLIGGLPKASANGAPGSLPAVGEPPPSPAPPSAPDCGISFDLESVNGAPSYLNTFAPCATHTEALRQATADIYQQITRSASEVFPLWVRWRTTIALNAYADGCKAGAHSSFSTAIAHLEAASSASPFNALAPLQLANLYEKCAAIAKDPWTIAYYEALALVRYLEVAELWPTLVEARYRTSVVAAALATAYDHPSMVGDPRTAIRKLVRLPGADQDVEPPPAAGVTSPPPPFSARLRRLAARESSATGQLLRPAYTMLREQRLRNQFEPSGLRRRELHHAVRISRHCVYMRKANAREPRWWRSLDTLRRDLVVHVWHLIFARSTISWQARYNAVCFDALVLAGPHGLERRRAWTENRALRHLDRAIREAGGELNREWVKNDPDMAVFA